MCNINAQTIIDQATAALAIAPTGDEWDGTYGQLKQIIAKSFDYFDETTCEDDYLISRECEELTGEWLTCYPEPAKFVTFKTSARGSHRVKNIQKNIENFIANVRKNAAAFGGGLVKKTKTGPRGVVWSAGAVTLYKQLIEDQDYSAALDLAENKLGVIWFDKGPRVAPVACEDWPGLMSGMLSDGTWEIFDPESGQRGGTHSLYKKDRSRAAAIASTSAYFGNKSSEDLQAAIERARRNNVVDQEAARTQWMADHGLSDDRCEVQRAKQEAEFIAQQEAARQARDIERAARAAQAAQDVAQVVAAAQAMAAIEQASESALLQEVASAEPAIEQQAQDSQELATVCEYEQQASESSAGAPNSPRGYIGSNHASQARQGGSAGHGQAINSKSGNWHATFFSGDDGTPSMVFNGGQVMVFESGSARMKALQTMARQADTEAAASTAARVCAAKQAAQEPKQTGAVPNSKTPQDQGISGIYTYPINEGKWLDFVYAKHAAGEEATYADFEKEQHQAPARESESPQDAAAPTFERFKPVNMDPRALLASGLSADQLIGLGVQYTGNMANPDGTGAITEISDTRRERFGSLKITVSLEDGRVIHAEPHYFMADLRPICQFNGMMHGAPYLAQLAAAVATVKAQASAAKEQADKAHAQALIDLAAKYPQLQQVAPGRYGNGKLCAINIRILLKDAFKGHKFSVTSDYSSVRVGWTDGPTDAEVNAVIGSFDIGASDTQTDYFYTVSTAFSDLFGGVQYLNTYRDVSDALVAKTLDAWWPTRGESATAAAPTAQDWIKGTGVFCWVNGCDYLRACFRKHLGSISTYQAPAAKARAKA